MDVTDALRDWGAAHAQARKAEQAAEQCGPSDRSGDLRREAESLREKADRLHREIYGRLGRQDGDRAR